MKRREGGRKSRVGTIFHGALSRPLPLLARGRLILPGEAEDKGGTREKEKRKKKKGERIINDDLVARSFLLERWTRTTVEKLYYRRVFRFSRPIDPIDF